MEKQPIRGTEHPLSLLQNEAYKVFTDLGFEIATGPELETEWYCFDALNMPKDHPSRDMQDTFYISEGNSSSAYLDAPSDPKTGKLLLRTHTSNAQIHILKKYKPIQQLLQYFSFSQLTHNIL